MKYISFNDLSNKEKQEVRTKLFEDGWYSNHRVSESENKKSTYWEKNGIRFNEKQLQIKQ